MTNMLDRFKRTRKPVSQRIMADESPGCGYRIRFFCPDYICFPVAFDASSADPIATRSNPLHPLRHRDYADFMISGDGIIVNRFVFTN
jgi:hypothetical protein